MKHNSTHRKRYSTGPDHVEEREPSRGRWKKLFLLFNSLITGGDPAISPPVLNASLDATAPGGYRVVHVAQTGMEADLLRQVLAEQGFEMPHVPSVWTGIVGQIDNPNIYVQAEQFEEAREFLREFLEHEGADEK